MKFLSHLFDNNRKWAAEIKRRDPEYFERLSKIQKPEYLWIGCADSRVPANEIVGLAPGELFVHRNIANIAPPFDTNVHSVLQYAVATLHVKHIIVCGHYGCGGVLAALREWSGLPLGKLAGSCAGRLPRAQRRVGCRARRKHPLASPV